MPRQQQMQQEEELALRDTGLYDEIEREFRPFFDEHGSRGVPLGELQQELRERGITQSIPQKRLDQLFTRANRNQDEFLSYNEFRTMMTEDMTRQERTKMRSVIAVAIENIVPRRYREDFLANYNCRPPPIFMILISITEIIIFIVYATELADAGNPVTATSGVPIYSPLIYRPSRRYEAWRFLTYMFIHQGYLHIVGNLFVQLLLGLPLELVHKWWRVLLIYVLGVIAGSLAHSMTDYTTALAGASGGCYAVLGAHIAAVITNWREMNYKCWEGSIKRMIVSAPIRLTACLLFAGSDTGMAIYRRFADESTGAKIGISAHIGGLLAGLLLGVPMLKNINTLPWEKTLGWVTLAIYLACVVAAVLFNGLYKGYPETDWSPCCT